MDLVVEVYKITAAFPNEERYGLTSQIKRSAVSIPSNISEGAGRNSSKEFNNFIAIANGSSFELQTQLILAERLGLGNRDITDKILAELDILQKMSVGFQRKLKI